MADKYKILDAAEYILGVVAAVGLFLFVQLNMSYELRDPDIWLHLKTGEYIVQHKTVPRIDIFSSTVENKSWIDHSWLVQVIFYLVFQFGTADNLIFLSALIVTFAFLFLFFSAYKGREYLTLSIGILFITILASKLRFNIRPENFSILFFSLYLFILRRLLRKNWLFLLPLIQLIWVNSHGFFILGPLMIGIFILAQELKRLRLLPWEWAGVDLLDKDCYRNLKMVFLLVCLACFINPYGYKGALYPVWVIFNTLGKSSIFYKYILELLPPARYYRAVSAYYLLIALSLSVFLLNLRRINFAYLMFWLTLLGVSIRVNRNVIFFNFFAFLVTTEGLINSLYIKRFNFLENLFQEGTRLLLYIVKFAIIALLIYWVATRSYPILLARYYIFEEGRTKSALLGIAAKGYPQKAADFILEKDLPGNIFNQFNDGSYLIYRLFPKKKVFIDGRTELYGESLFKDCEKILTVDKDTIDDAFNKYGINTVLLSEIVVDSELPRYLFESPDWALVYFDENSLIFLKDTPQNKTLINRLRLDLKKFKSQKAELEKIGLKNVYPDPYVDRGWIFYILGLDEQALNEAHEALRVLPNCSQAYNIIGRIYIKQKLYAQAFETLRLASIYAPFEADTLVSLGDFYAQTQKFDESLKIYKKLAKLYPYYAKGFYLLGRAYAEANNVKSAIKSVRRALKLDPFTAYYYKYLGELLKKYGDFKGASGVYQEAIDMGLDKSNFYNLLNAVRNKTK